jgi:hypothetical protein
LPKAEAMTEFGTSGQVSSRRMAKNDRLQAATRRIKLDAAARHAVHRQPAGAHEGFDYVYA